MFKLARKFGHAEGRFEILTATNSFHGRTLAGIAATGQDKVKKGFEPATPGFRHIPFNDLAAARAAISPATVAILMEGVQGEGGVTPATPEYLLGLRALCDEKKLLLFLDGVQCGHYRTGRFQSFQRILENVPGGEKFLPDGVSMAKSLGGGFPIGAFWVRAPYQDLLSAGTHGTTYGGTPLACAAALAVLDVLEQEKLLANAAEVGDFIRDRIGAALANAKGVVGVRGMGLMIGIELDQQTAPGAGLVDVAPLGVAWVSGQPSPGGKGLHGVNGAQREVVEVSLGEISHGAGGVVGVGALTADVAVEQPDGGLGP